jgi:hypothetical protein
LQIPPRRELLHVDPTPVPTSAETLHVVTGMDTEQANL